MFAFLVAVSDCLAQVENCSNGFDDDGDGFIDYYDGDCAQQSDGSDRPDCTGRPSDNVFDVEQRWRSESQTASSRALPLVADIDQDGTPEVIVYNEDNTIHILNGRTGTVERSHTYASDKATSGFDFPHLAVGDVDRDGYGEIFHVAHNGWIRAFNYELTLLWKQPMAFTEARPPALADFNGDGIAELYYGNEIRNALTGEVIVAGSHESGTYRENDWQRDLNGLAIAVDILPDAACASCEGLELVLGHVIYAVDIDDKQLREIRTMDDVGTKIGYTGDYYPKGSGFAGQNHSSTAVVDFNNDGYLDVLMSGATGSITGPSTVFLWDVANDQARTFIASRPASGIPATIPKAGGGTVVYRSYFSDLNGGPCDGSDDCTWNRGTSALSIANIDSDPEPECVFSSGGSLYAIDANMQPEWTRNLFVDPSHPNYGTPVNGNHVNFWDSSSGITGVTVFDFDGDGASELIHRDEVDLYVVDGWTGRVINHTYANLIKCSSQTLVEYPVVADVDGDNEAELLLACSDYENNRYESSGTNGASNQEAHLRVYEAVPGSFWLPARSIWNQFAYYNVNVNHDLSIPRQQQAHHLNFAASCADPNATDLFPLNQFLNQAPRMDACGEVIFPQARLDFAGEGVVVRPPTCPEDTLEITLTIENTGDKTVFRAIPLSFYARDPAEAYHNADPNPWLDTLSLAVPNGLAPGESIDTTVTIRGARGAYTLYASLNDIGPFRLFSPEPLSNEEFYPIYEINGTVPECDQMPTIVGRTVNPAPFQFNVTTFDNHRCGGTAGSIDSGQLIITDTQGRPLEPLSSYRFFLTELSTNTEVDVQHSVNNSSRGTHIFGLDSGSYQLRVRYQGSSFSCDEVTQNVRINRIEQWPEEDEVTVQKIRDVSSCRPGTADGEAWVLINGAVPDPSIYEVRWQDEQVPDRTILGHQVDNLETTTYEVYVTNVVSGCESNPVWLSMELETPRQEEPVISHPANCESNDGSVVARLAPADEASVSFLLIQISTSDTLANSDGVFTNLTAGLYELKVISKLNDCGHYRPGRIVELTDPATTSSLSAVVASVVSHDSACQDNSPAGSVRVDPVEGESFDGKSYDFQWQRVATKEVVSNQPTATGLAAGTYAVLVSDQCHFFTDTVVVEDHNPLRDDTFVEIVTNFPTLADGSDGSAYVRLRDAASASDYTFSWVREGDTVVSLSPRADQLPYGVYQLTIAHPVSQCSRTYDVVVGSGPATFPVSLSEVSDKTYGDAPFPLTVSNPTKRPVALRVAKGAASVEGTTVSIHGAGEVTIEVVPTNGEDNLSGRTSVTFTVDKHTQTIDSFDVISLNDSTFILNARASSKLPVIYRVAAGTATVVDSLLTVQAPGIIRVEAVQSGDTNHHPVSLTKEIQPPLTTGLSSHATSVRVYPNPSEEGLFRLYLPYSCTLVVYDGVGNLNQQKLARVGETVIDLRHAATGVYTLGVINYRGTFYYKLIKQ